jgi:hypothetical protein
MRLDWLFYSDAHPIFIGLLTLSAAAVAYIEAKALVTQYRLPLLGT